MGDEMEVITDETIKKDIERYVKRIEKAEHRLSELPDNVYGWSGQKERNRKQRILLDEIRHCQNLISIAREGLSEAYDAGR